MNTIRRAWLFILIGVILVFGTYQQSRARSQLTDYIVLSDYKQAAQLNPMTLQAWWSKNELVRLDANYHLSVTDVNSKTTSKVLDDVSLFAVNTYDANFKMAAASHSEQIFLLDDQKNFSPQLLLNFKDKANVLSLDFSSDSSVLVFGLASLPSLQTQNSYSGIYLLSLASGKIDRIISEPAKACMNQDGSKVYYISNPYQPQKSTLKAYNIISRESLTISKRAGYLVSCSKQAPLVAFTSETASFIQVNVYDEKTQFTQQVYEVSKSVGQIRNLWWSSTEPALYIHVSNGQNGTVEKLSFSRNLDHMAWSITLSFAVSTNEQNLVNTWMQTSFPSPCTTPIYTDQNDVVRDVNFQMDPIGENFWSVTYDITEHTLGQPSQCNWSAQFFLDKSRHRFSVTDLKLDNTRRYFISGTQIIKESEEGIFDAIDLQRFMAITSSTLTSSTYQIPSTRIPQALSVNEDGSTFTTAYNLPQNQSLIITMDSSPSRRGIVKAMTLPGQSTLISRAGRRNIIFYRDAVNKQYRIDIEDEKALTKAINGVLAQLAKNGALPKPPFIINQTMFVPVQNFFGQDALFSYLQIDLNGKTINVYQP